MWRCFGCGVGGSIFDFVMQIEGIEFGDALRLLAQKAGIELKPRDPSFARVQTERKRLSELVELAAQFFEKQLSSTTGEEVKVYLAKRGLQEETIKKWRLGYAPETERSLLDFLLERGYSLEEAGRAGLLVRTEGGVFDRFRSRIIFPILDLNSQAVGFGGRIFGDKAANKELAKYLNTSNTLLYDKSRILYGLDKAKLGIRKQDSTVLVEGYMDTILASQAGSENVVAVSGTALTPFQLKTLKRYSENLILSFDMDLGGETATRRGIDLAIGEGFNVKIVVMEQGQDPADVVLVNPAKWQDLITNAKSLFDFSFLSALSRFDKTSAEGKKAIAKMLLPFIKRIPNAIEQSHWIHRLAEELGIKEELVQEELKKIKEEALYVPFARDEGVLPSAEKTRKDILEERVFILLFRNHSLLAFISDNWIPYVSLQAKEILAGMQKSADFTFQVFESLFGQEIMAFLSYVAMRAEVESWEEGEEENLEQELQSCLTHLKRIALKEQIDELTQKIKSAEKEGGTVLYPPKLQELLEQFHTLSKSLHAS